MPSQGIFTGPLPELPKTQSLLTLVGGKIVHEVNQISRRVDDGSLTLVEADDRSINQMSPFEAAEHKDDLIRRFEC